MPTTFITPVEVTPASTGWQDVDVSSYIASGATGVILHIENTNATARAIGLRKNGSGDEHTQNMGASAHTWAIIGVDGSRIFEAYTATDVTYYNIWLVGYFDSDCSFLTNSTPVTVNSTSWADRHAPGAYAGAVYEIANGGSWNVTSVRPSGSTSNLLHDAAAPEYNRTWALVKPGTSNYVQAMNSQTGTETIYYLGYLGSNSVSLHTDAISRATGTTGSWVTVTSPNSSAVGGVYQLYDNGWTGYNIGVRKSGSSESIIRYLGMDAWGYVEVDTTNHQVEQNITNVDVDLYEWGYFLPETGGPPINIAINATNSSVPGVRVR